VSLSFDPTALEYGDVPAASTVAKTVEVSNPGATAETLSAAAPFSVAPAEIPAGAVDLAVTVTFAPATQGPATAALGAPPGACSLAGIGINPITIDAGLDFGEVEVNATVTKVVMVNNRSDQDATVSITAGSPFTAVHYDTVPAHFLLAIPVTFTPDATGPATATLLCAVGAAGSGSCALSGAGVQAPVSYESVAEGDDEVVGGDAAEKTVEDPYGDAEDRVEADEASAETHREYKVFVPHPETTLNLGRNTNTDRVMVDGFGLDTVKHGYLNACGQIGIQAAEELFVQSTGKNIYLFSKADQALAAGGAINLLGKGGVNIATVCHEPVAVDSATLMPVTNAYGDASTDATIAGICFTAFDAVVAAGCVTRSVLAATSTTGKFKALFTVPSALGLACTVMDAISVVSSIGSASGSFTAPPMLPPGVSIYGHGGIMLTTPVFAGFYAGAGMVISSLYPFIMGFDVEVFGRKSAILTGHKEAVVQSSASAKVTGELSVDVTAGVAGTITAAVGAVPTSSLKLEPSKSAAWAATELKLESGAAPGAGSVIKATPTSIDLEAKTKAAITVGAFKITVGLSEIKIEGPAGGPVITANASKVIIKQGDVSKITLTQGSLTVESGLEVAIKAQSVALQGKNIVTIKGSSAVKIN
jgi:hypothetical protein